MGQEREKTCNRVKPISPAYAIGPEMLMMRF